MGWFTQDETPDTKVEVKGGVSRDTGSATTEFIIADRTSSSGAHDHVVISDSGDVIHDTTGSL